MAKALEAVKDERTSEERVIDTALEALIRKFTEAQEWAWVELTSNLMGKVLLDREAK